MCGSHERKQPGGRKHTVASKLDVQIFEGGIGRENGKTILQMRTAVADQFRFDLLQLELCQNAVDDLAAADAVCRRDELLPKELRDRFGNGGFKRL
jgi:hypothetical protein